MNCENCDRDYNSSWRRPVVGGCGHTFCHYCTKKFRQSLCPTCQAPSFTQPPPNFAILHMVVEDKTEDRESSPEPEEEEEAPPDEGPYIPMLLVYVVIFITFLIFLPFTPIIFFTSIGYAFFWLSGRCLQLLNTVAENMFTLVCQIVFTFHMVGEQRRLAAQANQNQ